MQLVALGSDPELFLQNEEGKIVSAIGQIGGTKKRPRPIKELGKGYTVQEDNVLLEYNTPAAKSFAKWVEAQHTMLTYLKEMVGAKSLGLATIASNSMDPEQMKDPRAWVFGCDPDYDVWAKKWNKPPKAADPLLRSAGGHVHIAYDNPNVVSSIKIGRALDFTLGAPLAMVDPDKRRAELYGKPGAIRFKPYGLEYRTPSNYWTFSQKNVEFVWRAANQACRLAEIYQKYEKKFIDARQSLEGKPGEFDMYLIEDLIGRPV